MICVDALNHLLKFKFSFFSPEKKTVARLFLVILSLSLLSPSFCFAAKSDTTIQLTEAEQSFLRDHPVIVLGTEKDWEPSVILNKDGTISGYDAAILARINALTGANFQLKAGSWDEMQELAKQKTIDGLSTGAIHEERKSYLNFSDIYFSVRKTVMVPLGNPVKLRSLNDLQNKTIAIHGSNLVDEKLAKSIPGAVILRTATIKETLEAVMDGKADAMFGNGTALYYAQKYNLPYVQIAFPLDETLRLAFGVRKDWPEAIAILNKGLAAIPDKEKLKIKNKWYLVSPAEFGGLNQLSLSAEERKYLASRKPITMCTDPNWPPYVSFNTKGEMQGIFAELNEIITQKIGKAVSLVGTATWDESERLAKEHKCDILLAAADTTDRRRYMNFTSTLLSIPTVIATKSDKLFIEDFERLSGETFSVVKGYAAVQFLEKSYPDIKIALVDTPREGMKLVHNGEVFGYIDSLLNIATIIQKQNYFDLKVAGKLDYNYELGIGIRNDDPLLLSIYEKAVSSISQEERQKLLDQAIVVRYDKGFDYTLFKKIFSGLILFMMIGTLLVHLYMTRKSRAELELQVAQRTTELKSKNAELERFNYTVSHDLKSPLITIQGFVEILEKSLGDRIDDNARVSINFIKTASSKMSDKLSGLLSLSSLGHSAALKERVALHEIAVEARDMVSGLLKGSKINISIADNLPIVIGDRVQLQELVQNLLENAIKYMGGQSAPRIEVGTAESNGQTACFVRDNGIGILPEYHEEVFALFNRLSSDGEGTGIGLSKVHRIIELHGGEIWIESEGNNQGTIFWFILPSGVA
jgi:polar amino acid transport system substrate-binding protein